MPQPPKDWSKMSPLDFGRTSMRVRVGTLLWFYSKYPRAYTAKMAEVLEEYHANALAEERRNKKPATEQEAGATEIRKEGVKTFKNPGSSQH